MITAWEFTKERQQLAIELADKFMDLLADNALSKGSRTIELPISDTYSTSPKVQMLMRDSYDMEEYVGPILDRELKKYGWNCTLKFIQPKNHPSYYKLTVFPS